jgi:hypothetical protein
MRSRPRRPSPWLLITRNYISSRTPKFIKQTNNDLFSHTSKIPEWLWNSICLFTYLNHRRLCRVKNILAMYLKYHKAGLTPTTSVTSTAISSVKMAIGHKSLTNLRSEMIFLQGKPVFYIFLPSTPPYWQIILRFCWLWTPTWQQRGK